MSQDSYTWLNAYTSPFLPATALGEVRVPDPTFRENSMYYRLELTYRSKINADGRLCIKLANNPLNNEGIPIMDTYLLNKAVDPMQVGPYSTNFFCQDGFYTHLIERQDPAFFQRLTDLNESCSQLRVCGGGIKLWPQPASGASATPTGLIRGYQIDTTAYLAAAPIIPHTHVPDAVYDYTKARYPYNHGRGWTQMFKSSDYGTGGPPLIHDYVDTAILPFARPGRQHLQVATDGMTARFQDATQFKFSKNRGWLTNWDTAYAWVGDFSPEHKMNADATLNRQVLTKYNGSVAGGSVWYGKIYDRTGMGATSVNPGGAPVWDLWAVRQNISMQDPEAVVFKEEDNNGFDLLVMLDGGQTGADVIVQCVWHIEYVPTKHTSTHFKTSPADPAFPQVRLLTDDEANFPIFVKGHSFWSKLADLAGKVAGALVKVGKVAAFFL